MQMVDALALDTAWKPNTEWKLNAAFALDTAFVPDTASGPDSATDGDDAVVANDPLGTSGSAAVVGVVGGSGGVGSSSFAAVLAAALAGHAGRAVLVDVDPAGGGADVLVGIEAAAGVRWSGLRVDGGRLDADVLLERLPVWQAVSVLACDDRAPSPAAALQVVRSLAGGGRVQVPVVLDLPRNDDDVRAAVLPLCSLVLLIAGAAVREVSAARAVVARLRPALSAPLGVVVRRGPLAASVVADLLGVGLLGELPSLRLEPEVAGGPGRRTHDVAAGLRDALLSVPVPVPVPASIGRSRR